MREKHDPIPHLFIAGTFLVFAACDPKPSELDAPQDDRVDDMGEDIVPFVAPAVDQECSDAGPQSCCLGPHPSPQGTSAVLVDFDAPDRGTGIDELSGMTAAVFDDQIVGIVVVHDESNRVGVARLTDNGTTVVPDSVQTFDVDLPRNDLEGIVQISTGRNTMRFRVLFEDDHEQREFHTAVIEFPSTLDAAPTVVVPDEAFTAQLADGSAVEVHNGDKQGPESITVLNGVLHIGTQKGERGFVCDEATHVCTQVYEDDDNWEPQAYTGVDSLGLLYSVDPDRSAARAYDMNDGYSVSDTDGFTIAPTDNYEAIAYNHSCTIYFGEDGSGASGVVRVQAFFDDTTSCTPNVPDHFGFSAQPKCSAACGAADNEC